MRSQIAAAALVGSLVASAAAWAATGSVGRARPDLVVSSISNLPSAVFPGRGFRVTERTRNIGGARAPATVTQYYFSSDGQRTAVGRRSVPRLGPNRSTQTSATAKVPGILEPGIYSFVACADGKASVRESNERNNCRTAAKKIVVKKPPPPV
jgi:subtilase family serine protease